MADKRRQQTHAAQAAAGSGMAELAPGLGVTSTQMVEAFKHNMEVALRVASATFEGAERMREIQLAAAKSAHTKAADLQKTVTRAGSPNDLWAVEQRMLLDNIQEALTYWNELLAATSQTNAAIAQILNTEFAQAGKKAAKDVEKTVGALGPGGQREPEWVGAVASANAAYRQLWENTSRMLESLNSSFRAMETGGRVDSPRAR